MTNHTPAIDPWQPSGSDYDRSIHHNPDAKAWADLFIDVFPGLKDKHDLMLGWFANAMMAMHDHIHSQPNPLSAQLAAVTAQRDELLAAMRKLACLGNGDKFGNSDGNLIAQDAIAKCEVKP